MFVFLFVFVFAFVIVFVFVFDIRFRKWRSVAASVAGGGAGPSFDTACESIASCHTQITSKIITSSTLYLLCI